MATQVQWRGGSTAEHSTFTGAAREVTVDTQKKTLVVHDGSTAGGEPLLREDQNNLPTSVTNGISVPSANTVALSTNGTGRLFVDASGNVGVGSPPVFPFHAKAISDGSALAVACVENAGVLASTESRLQFVQGGNSFRGAYVGGINESSSGQPTSFVIGTSAAYSTPTERLRITSAGLVGIGTSTPSKKLEIANGDVRLSDGYTISWGDDAWRIFRNGAQLRFDANGTQALTIDSSQRVGIGTTVPGSFDAEANQLVIGSGAGDQGLTIYTGSAVGDYGSIFFADGTSGGATKKGQIRYEHNNEVMSFWTNETERCRLDLNGRLLVGTTSDYAENVQAAFYGASNGGIALASGTNGLSRLMFADATAGNAGAYVGSIIYNHAEDSLRFNVNGGTERMRIDSSGNVLIATTSSSSTTDSGVVFANNGSSVWKADGTGNLNQLDFYRGTSGSYAQVGKIVTNSTGTSFTSVSDYRLKENAVLITDGITRLQQLKPSRFNFIVDSDKTVDGFIAHEVQTVVPEAITGEKDAVDDEGNPQYQGIDQSKLVPLLTAALQEAVAKIESLEARLTAAGI